MKSALPVQQTGLPLVNYINTVNKTNLIFIYNDLVFIVYLWKVRISRSFLPKLTR